MKRQAEANEHLRAITELRARDEERQTDAIKALSKATGVAVDQIMALGISTSNATDAMSAVRSSVVRTDIEGRLGKLGSEQYSVDVLREATKYAKPLMEYGRTHGGLGGLMEQVKNYEVKPYRPTGTPGIEWKLPNTPAEERHELAAKLAYTLAYERELSDAKSALSKAFDAGKVTVNNNFNGPVTNRVELRNDDPDRVMFAITDTMAKMAAVRTTSRYTPVGTGAP